MADTNRYALRYVKEVTWGTTPSSALQTLRPTSGNFRATLNTIQSAELIQDAQLRALILAGKAAAGEFGYELSYGTWDELLEGVFRSTWQTDTGLAGAERCQHLDLHRAAEPACCRASQLPALRAVALQGEADVRLGPAQCVHRRTERHVLPCDWGPARPLALKPRAYPVAFRLVAHLKIRRIRATVRSTMRTARVRGVPSFT